MNSPSEDEFRHVARQWAEAFDGSCEPNSHVRLTKYGASVSIRTKDGRHYKKPVTFEEARTGTLNEWNRAQMQRCKQESALADTIEPESR